jgi:hypothetical protein
MTKPQSRSGIAIYAIRHDRVNESVTQDDFPGGGGDPYQLLETQAAAGLALDQQLAFALVVFDNDAERMQIDMEGIGHANILSGAGSKNNPTKGIGSIGLTSDLRLAVHSG